MLSCILIHHVYADVQPDYTLPQPEEGNDTIKLVSDSNSPNTYSATVKDGEYTATVTDNVVLNTTLYVREGTIEIGNGTGENNTAHTLNINGPAGSNRVGISIAGKNANVKVNNGTLIANSSYYFNTIGSCDGNGTLTAENGSYIKFGGASHVIIGESTDTDNEYVYGNFTTESPESSTRYQGIHNTAANGSGAEFGRGEINIKSKSVLDIGMNFYMSEGSLNIDDSTATIGGLIANRALINLNNNSTADINLANNAKLYVQTKEFTTNYGNNSTTNINISDNSEIIFRETTADHPEVVGNQSEDVYVYLGRYGANSKTEINVTSGSKLTFETSHVSLGKSGTNSGSTASIHIDTESEMATAGMIINDTGKLTNEGTISDNGASYDLINIIGQGQLINSGEIDGVVTSNSGSITALDGATFKGIDLYGGSLKIEGNVTMNEWLYSDSAKIVFSLDGSINMQEYACDLYDTELFLNIDGIVSDSTIIDKNDFFTNLSDTTIDDSVTITLVGTNGSTSVRYLNNINKGIPEPTTATLSLLALVTLSMRRRRRQEIQKTY